VVRSGTAAGGGRVAVAVAAGVAGYDRLGQLPGMALMSASRACAMDCKAEWLTSLSRSLADGAGSPRPPLAEAQRVSRPSTFSLSAEDGGGSGGPAAPRAALERRDARPAGCAAATHAATLCISRLDSGSPRSVRAASCRIMLASSMIMDLAASSSASRMAMSRPAPCSACFSLPFISSSSAPDARSCRQRSLDAASRRRRASASACTAAAAGDVGPDGSGPSPPPLPPPCCQCGALASGDAAVPATVRSLAVDDAVGRVTSPPGRIAPVDDPTPCGLPPDHEDRGLGGEVSGDDGSSASGEGTSTSSPVARRAVVYDAPADPGESGAPFGSGTPDNWTGSGIMRDDASVAG